MNRNQGFTLPEILIATAIVLVLAVALGNFAKESLVLNRDASQRLNAEFANLKSFRTMLQELRSASSVTAVSSTSIAFSYITEDGEEETLRYFLDTDASLKRESDDSLRVLVSEVEVSSTTPIFSYEGGLVEIFIVSHGKEHSVTAVPRNLSQ